MFVFSSPPQISVTHFLYLSLPAWCYQRFCKKELSLVGIHCFVNVENSFNLNHLYVFDLTTSVDENYRINFDYRS